MGQHTADDLFTYRWDWSVNGYVRIDKVYAYSQFKPEQHLGTLTLPLSVLGMVVSDLKLAESSAPDWYTEAQAKLAMTMQEYNEAKRQLHKSDPRTVGSDSSATIVGTPRVTNFGHEQVLVRHGDRSAYVDSGIADLIVELWSEGIDTDNSCQGGVQEYVIHRPYITGHGVLDLPRFVDVLASFGYGILHLDTAWTYGRWRAVLVPPNG